MDPYLPRAHGKDWILKGESALKTRQAHIFRVTLGQTAHFQRTLLGAHGNATRLPTVESAPMFRRAIHTRPIHPLVDEWKRCELSLHHIFVCAGTHTNIHLWVYMPCPHARRVASITSDSVWPHGLQPIRLLCPWDSPGKNSGVGCCSPLQGTFRSRDQTHVSCIGRQILYTDTTWKALQTCQSGPKKKKNAWGAGKER